jgi:NAD(P)-dependent dehydrogenase (short-subunit alcohol dehydrogenase family)
VNLRLEGQRALVVGASGDIGQAIVHVLAEEGVRVVAASPTLARAQSCPESHGAVCIDLRDDASIHAGVAGAEELLGGIDLLVVTAAGEVNYAGIWGVSRQDWESELSLKTVGTSVLCAAVARGMVERGGGVIVTVIGVATDMTVVQNPIGSATNSGLRSYTRVLAAELAPSGVRVVGISPGMIASRRFERFATDSDAVAQSIPLGSLGEPRHVADVVAFAASPRAAYNTGAIVPVDGGRTLVR